ncbi:hypothetical protein [Tenacibaculum sp. UWU-22]|uniref:hypothetical protein n=1 Tax=Tenacibaculum sp. UWU-22 TaxID=3234187 RepID=UPI0034DB4D00
MPLLFYIILSSGIHNFAKLPIVNKDVIDISTIDSTQQFKNNISIVTFIGNDINKKVKAEIFNLNEKIYKPFYEFKHFQFIVIVPNTNKTEIEHLKKQINGYTNMKKWRFVFTNSDQIKTIYNSFKTNEPLDSNLHSSKAFIIDKHTNLRGRTDDKDSPNGLLLGYNMQSVAELNNKMKDDVKVILAEYRLALKKNNADRENN